MTNRFWHPFADMAAVAGAEIVIDRGEGVWVWDDAGRRYLDANAGLWYCSVGHGRAELADAAAAQMRRLAAYSAFGPFAAPVTIDLAGRVADLAPVPGGVVFFTSGGSDAVDTAAKLVRRYWSAVGQPERQVIISRTQAYHGMNAFGTSLAGIPGNADGYGELVPHTVLVPYDDPAAVARAIAENAGRVAAVFGEPVVGAGGILPPPDGYWPEVARTCRENDVLLVADEVVTGFGRLGRWFGSHRYEVQPDILLGAKGITSGYAPLGVVVVGERVQEPFWHGDAGVFKHGYTYSGHATACAVAMANLDIVEHEDLVARAAAMEPVLARAVAPLADHAVVGEVRAVGMLAAVELAADAVAAEPGLVDRVVRLVRENGVLLRALVGRTLQISPPLVIEEAEITTMTAAIDAALEAASL